MVSAARRALYVSFIVVTAAAAAIGVAADQSPAASQTAASRADRFQRVPDRGGVAAAIKPRLLDDTLVKVVAVLAGDSVATVQETANRRLTRQEKNAVKAQRAAQQAAMRGSLEAAGGRVVGTFQSAINGVKLTIPRNRIEELRQIPGVIDVRRVGVFTHENVVSVPRTQAPFAWAGVNGVRGEGVKVAIIDTGIDYTHADFGGPGTTAAFDLAAAASADPADAAFFGPNAPKVKGGTDLVGDDYDANVPAKSTPAPDPNPLDCNGHGSHVAGSAAGFGVLANGSTYGGVYDQTIYSNFSFSIGPGVAPKADLYAVRVFGCEGSTDVVIDAIEWAVDNDMDVINMSLGADFEPGDTADALAADNAVKAGIVVVSAAGNAGDVHYILGSPGSATKGIAVAASIRQGFNPTANLGLPALPAAPAKTITAIVANGAPLNFGSLTVKVLRTATGGVSLGCDPAEYAAAGVTGKLVVTQRGVCARVARAIFGQQAGAAAVVMVNNAASLPPFEGPITSNPDTGDPFVVTIPFFGVAGTVSNPASDGFALVQRDGLSVSIAAGTPIQTGTASFSSTGPRTPDSLLKPDITAPGDSIVSALVGSGNQPLTISGTSMATPHVAGAAALAIQSHPKWKPAAVKSAILNSGNPGDLSDYTARRNGSGFINAAAAVGTLVYAYADKDETTVNFGFENLTDDFSRTQAIHLKNDGPAASFNVSVTNQQGSPHSVALSHTMVNVPKNGSAAVNLTLNIPAATVGDSLPTGSDDAFHDVAGIITFTPTSPNVNRGITLRVPYYVVPRASSNVTTSLSLKRHATLGVANIQNKHAAVPGTADFYAWGLESPNDRMGRIDLRAAGVSSFDLGGDQTVVFAINTFKGWTTPEQQEFDVSIDTNNDGHADFVIFNADLGELSGGDPTGEELAAVFDLNTGDLFADFFAVAPANGSTILLPVLAQSLGITPANPRLSYTAAAFDLLSDDSDSFTGTASFNAFTSAISTGQFEVIAPDDFVSVSVSIDPTEAAITPSLGLMVVTQDNKNGPREADLLPVNFEGR